MVLPGARAHLDKDESPLVFCHQVNLTLGPAPVALQDSKSAFLQ